MNRIDTHRFAGVFPALLTPFDREGRVHAPVLAALTQRLLDAGVQGFYICGSSAEAMMMTLEERKTVLETVTAVAAGKAVCICHVGCINADHAVELARHAARHGADLVSAVPPYYYKFTFAEIRRYYSAIADAASLPLLLYSIPASSGVTLTKAQFDALLSDPRIVGVKYTASDFYTLERLRHAHPDIVLYNGYDEMFLAGQSMGADGGIGTTYNFMPEKFLAMRRFVEQGDRTAALAVQASVNNVIEEMLRYGVLPATKAVLRAQGLDFGECRPPFRPLEEAECASLLAVCRREGVL